MSTIINGRNLNGNLDDVVNALNAYESKIRGEADFVTYHTEFTFNLESGYGFWVDDLDGDEVAHIVCDYLLENDEFIISDINHMNDICERISGKPGFHADEEYFDAVFKAIENCDFCKAYMLMTGAKEKKSYDVFMNNNTCAMWEILTDILSAKLHVYMEYHHARNLEQYGIPGFRDCIMMPGSYCVYMTGSETHDLEEFINRLGIDCGEWIRYWSITNIDFHGDNM